MAKTPVFVSLDFDNHRALRDLIIGQARNPDSPYDVIDHSLKESAPQRDWEEKARRAISRSDVFIVMLGAKTRFAPGVLKDVKIANDLNKRRFQIIGYQYGSEDWAVPGAGITYQLGLGDTQADVSMSSRWRCGFPSSMRPIQGLRLLTHGSLTTSRAVALRYIGHWLLQVTATAGRAYIPSRPAPATGKHIAYFGNKSVDTLHLRGEPVESSTGPWRECV